MRTSLAGSLPARMAQAVRSFGPLRVPLAGTLVLLILPLLALAKTSAASGLLRGLFDLAVLFVASLRER